jgi:hypothetical protein
MANETFKQMDAAERVNSDRNEQGGRLVDEYLAFGRLLPDARLANSTADQCLPGLELTSDEVPSARRQPVESSSGNRERDASTQRAQTTDEPMGRSAPSSTQEMMDRQTAHGEAVRPNGPADRPNNTPSDRQSSSMEPRPGITNLSVWEYIYRPVSDNKTTREPQRIK